MQERRGENIGDLRRSRKRHEDENRRGVKAKVKEKQAWIRTKSRIRKCEKKLGEDEVAFIFLPIGNY